jgi:hypothetical protein
MQRSAGTKKHELKSKRITVRYITKSCDLHPTAVYEVTVSDPADNAYSL